MTDADSREANALDELDWWARKNWHTALGSPELMDLETASALIRRLDVAFYAYILWRWDAAPWPVPFYVGKGTTRRKARGHNSRLSAHEADARHGRGFNPEKEAVFRKSEVSYTVELHPTVETAAAREVELIALIGRRDWDIETGPLWNHTPGGDGVTEHAPDAIARITEASRKRGISAAMLKAAIRAISGKPLSPEHRARIGAANLGREHTEDTRANMVRAWTEERKAGVSSGLPHSEDSLNG